MVIKQVEYQQQDDNKIQAHAHRNRAQSQFVRPDTNMSSSEEDNFLTEVSIDEVPDIKILEMTPTASEILDDSPKDCVIDGCKSSFTNQGHLLMHLRNYHKCEIVDEHKHNIKRYFCPETSCKYNKQSEPIKYFTDDRLLKQHYVRVHKKKDCVCDKCGKVLATGVLLRMHIKRCGIVFACVDCNGKYSSREALLTHCRRKGHRGPPVKQKKMADRLLGQTKDVLILPKLNLNEVMDILDAKPVKKQRKPYTKKMIPLPPNPDEVVIVSEIKLTKTETHDVSTGMDRIVCSTTTVDRSTETYPTASEVVAQLSPAQKFIVSETVDKMSTRGTVSEVVAEMSIDQEDSVVEILPTEEENQELIDALTLSPGPLIKINSAPLDEATALPAQDLIEALTNSPEPLPIMVAAAEIQTEAITVFIQSSETDLPEVLPAQKQFSPVLSQCLTIPAESPQLSKTDMEVSQLCTQTEQSPTVLSVCSSTLNSGVPSPENIVPVFIQTLQPSSPIAHFSASPLTPSPSISHNSEPTQTDDDVINFPESLTRSLQTEDPNVFALPAPQTPPNSTQTTTVVDSSSQTQEILSEFRYMDESLIQIQRGPCHIETQTEIAMLFQGTEKTVDDNIDQILYAHMETQTCDSELPELCLADIQTQTDITDEYDELFISTETQTAFFESTSIQTQTSRSMEHLNGVGDGLRGQA